MPVKLKTQTWHQRFRQQARWTADLRSYLFERAGLSETRRALEVGCGTGAVLTELEASESPAKRSVHGLDLDYAFLRTARDLAPGAHLANADAHELPYRDGCFDLVFCHFLMLWVEDPAAVLSEMVRITHSGGRVMALAEPDYGGRVDYPQDLSRLGVWQEQGLKRQGADTRLGRRLGVLLKTAGLKSVENGVLGGQWRQAPTFADWELEWQFLEYDLENLIPKDELENWKQRDREVSQRGERLLFVPTFYAWGIVE